MTTTILYMLDDKCPTCQEPDRSELENAQRLCRYASKRCIPLHLNVLLGGNSGFKCLRDFAAQKWPDGIPYPVFALEGQWYEHAEDLIPVITERTRIHDED